MYDYPGAVGTGKPEHTGYPFTDQVFHGTNRRPFVLPIGRHYSGNMVEFNLVEHAVFVEVAMVVVFLKVQYVTVQLTCVVWGRCFMSACVKDCIC